MKTAKLTKKEQAKINTQLQDCKPQYSVHLAGSGSEAIGAGRAGWDIIEGVEITKEYIPIANQRLEHWLK